MKGRGRGVPGRRVFVKAIGPELTPLGPRLRAFQLGQGEVTLAWLRRRFR